MPKFYACAKINLSLAVTGRFADGYHAVDTIMQEISLTDTLYVSKANKINVSCGVCEPHKNTAYRAAEIFFKNTGIVGGADIEIEKHIPAEAGLGGGSSDAASVLGALNVLYKSKLDRSALMFMGVQVGMDVPFFIAHGCMRARGKGDLLTRIENRLSMSYLIIKPEGGVSTVNAYNAYDMSPVDYNPTPVCVAALTEGDRDAYFQNAENALFDAACELNQDICEAVQDAYSTGAVFAMMTGSGSAVFAVYPHKAARKQAAAALLAKYPFVAEADDM